MWFKEGSGVRGQGSESRGQRSGISGGGAAGSPPTAIAGQPAAPQQPLSDIGPIKVAGRLLSARIVLGEPEPTVSNLTIEDGVCFSETQTAQAGEQPLSMRGDRLVAENLSATNAKVTVTGRPAQFDGRGLGLIGSNINLDRGANRLWIDGPGQMGLPIKNDLQGQAPAAPGTLTVDWQRGMDFDGQTARFEQSVVAATSSLQSESETMRFQLQTASMFVKLPRPISFSRPKMEGTPQVEEIRCIGGVSMENRTFDPQQQLTSHDRMQLSDLAINVLSGALNGGPGWLNSCALRIDHSAGRTGSYVTEQRSGQARTAAKPAPLPLCAIS